MIRLMKSTFHKEAETKAKLVKFIAETEILSMNRQCAELEQAFAAKQGRKYAAFVSSGSMANLILIQVLLNLGRLKQGDRVGISALTWATNVMPVIQLGLKPVLLDVERDTLNVGSAEVERQLDNIDALFLTNALGFCSDIERIAEVCAANGKLFLEDNCESLGTRTAGKLLGNFGAAATFSTFVGHHLSTIEGGFIVTDDSELHEMVMIVRAHGWDRNLSKERQQARRGESGADEFYSRYTFYDIAMNGRATDIQGFIGNCQLGYWDEICAAREANYQRFAEAIAANDDFLPLRTDHLELVSNFAVPVICQDRATFDKYRQRFEDGQVEIRPIIAGDMAEQPFFKKHVPDQPANPKAAFLHRHGFYFPNNQELTEEEKDHLVSLLKK
jgi:CDP-6-deoxy-D-xylo-4-hexulose-3-dehydrase